MNEPTADQNEQTDETEAPQQPTKEGRTVPYSRFAEVNAARKEAETKLAEAATVAAELATYKAKAIDAERRAMQLSACLAAGLPIDLAPRLQGMTEEEMKADAAKLAALGFGKPAAPNIDATATGQQAETFTAAQLADPEFYKANRTAILRALAAGRVTS